MAFRPAEKDLLALTAHHCFTDGPAHIEMGYYVAGQISFIIISDLAHRPDFDTPALMKQQDYRLAH